jgi:amidohydrolase
MRHIQVIMLIALLLLAYEGSAHAESEPTVEYIVGRYTDALGGKQKLESTNVIHTSFVVTIQGLKGTLHEWAASDGRHHIDLDLAGQYKVVMVLNDGEGWIRNQNGPVSELGGQGLKEEVSAAFVSTYSYLIPGRMPGKTTFEGIEETTGYHVLHTAPLGGVEVTFFVDPVTFLPVRSEQPQGSLLLTATFSDWKEFDGVRMPTHVLFSTGATPNDQLFEIKTVEINGPVPPGIFEKPADDAQGSDSAMRGAVATTSTSSVPPTAEEASMQAGVEKAVIANGQSLIAFRRDLHRHPELAGQEIRTARVIADRMRAAGLEVVTGVGGHGVVAVLKGGRPGPVVAYRADMDAIATTGPDPVDFRSVDETVRHGCGHDIHMAVAVGMAEALMTVRDEISGTIVFLFQPAEENGEGAAAMIKDGALKDPKPEAIFAVHCAPLETGIAGSKAGMLLGGLDVVRVRLTGEGDHDAVTGKVTSILAEINTVKAATPEVEGESDFTLAGVFQAGPAEDGNGTMVVGMVRCSSEEKHDAAKALIEERLAAIATEGVDIEVDYSKYLIPPLMNDADLVASGNAVVERISGANALFVVEGVTPFFSEDFSQFQQHIPGALYYLGVSNSAQGIVGLPHSPNFVANEDAIAFGVKTMSAILVNYLENH